MSRQEGIQLTGTWTMYRHQQYSPNPPTFQESLDAAEQFVSLFHHINAPTEEQHAVLAAAHYTLASQDTISLYRSKMHLNSAITLLQGIKNHPPNWFSLMANAYVKRAELVEQENGYTTAIFDYQRALEVFESYPEADITNLDKLMLAQCAISIADLVVHEQQFDEGFSHCFHPLFYVNQALGYLSTLPMDEDEMWTTLAYAHQIAGLALTPIDRTEAIEAFRTAITMAFKADSKVACGVLGDIYNSMGLFYEQYFHNYPIQKVPLGYSDYAMIYFGVALFFSPNEAFPYDEDNLLLHSIFESIYRVLDPFLPSLSPTVMRDFIDALIFIYYCVSDQTLPNQELCRQLKEPEMLNTYAQHIYWLVVECYRRDNTQARLLKLVNPDKADTRLDTTELLGTILNQTPKNNVHYLKTKVPNGQGCFIS
jgi:tetratricopeptide (TPR) repeat protein